MSASSHPARELDQIGRLVVGPMLAVTLFGPAVIFYLSLSSSLALGMCAAAAIVLVVTLELRVSPSADRRVSVGLVAGFVSVAVLLHAAISAFLGPVDFVRAVSSLLPLVALIVAGGALATLISMATPSRVTKLTFGCFVTLAILGLLPTLGIMPLAPRTGALSDRPVFPFTEPSHYALVVMPILIFCCVCTSGWRRFAVLGVMIGISLLLGSVTLLAGCLLAALVSLRVPALLFFAALLVAIAVRIDLTYYIERLDFIGEVQNLTALIYLQGWQMIGDSLQRSAGWGIGFQQLGLQVADTFATRAVFALTGNYVNVLDGGFTFAKFASEFGALGIGITMIYLRGVWRATLALRAFARRKRTLPVTVVFAYSILVGYFIEFFARGVGYFSGTAVLLVAALWLLSSNRPATSAQAALQPEG